MAGTPYQGNPLDAVLQSGQDRLDALTAATGAPNPYASPLPDPAQGTQPQAPGLPNAQTSPTDTKAAIEGLSRTSKVPANILMALAETAGAQDHASALQIASAAAARLAPMIAAGKTPDAAISELLGPKAGHEVTGKILNRAYDIARQLYPQKEAPRVADDRGIATTIKDHLVNIARNVGTAGVATGLRGGGELLASVGDSLVRPINDVYNILTGQPIDAPSLIGPTPVLGRGTSQAITNWINTTTDPMLSDVARQKIADNQIEGSIADPSSWKMGKNWSVEGLLYGAENVFGSMAPAVVVAIATKGNVAAGAAAGVAGTAGDAAQTSDQTIDGLDAQIMPDGRTALETQSPVYRAALAAGKSRDAALAETKAKGAQMAAMLTAPVGFVAGALGSKLLNPAEHMFDKLGNRVVRSAARGALTAADEGLQEVGEGVGGALGSNIGAGTNTDIFQGSMANLLLGALGGGATGTGVGLLSPGHPKAAPGAALPPPAGPATSPPQPGPRMGVEPASAPPGAVPQGVLPGAASPLPPGPSPSDVGPAGAVPGAVPQGAAPAAVPPGLDTTPQPGDEAMFAPGATFHAEPPAGPLSDAMALAPLPSLGDAKMGQRFTVDLLDGTRPMEAQFIEETPHGPRVQFADGSEEVIPRPEIDSGRVKLTPIDATTPRPDAMPVPKAFGKKDGTAFETEEQAKRAGTKRVGAGAFTVLPTDGGFVVVPHEPLPEQLAAPAPPAAPAPAPVKETAREPLAQPQEGAQKPAPGGPRAQAPGQTGAQGVEAPPAGQAGPGGAGHGGIPDLPAGGSPALDQPKPSPSLSPKSPKADEAAPPRKLSPGEIHAAHPDRALEAHAKANLVIDRTLPGRQKEGAPLAQIQVGETGTGRFMARLSFQTSRSGHGAPIGGDYPTAAAAEADAKATIRAHVQRIADAPATSDTPEIERRDAQKILDWLGPAPGGTPGPATKTEIDGQHVMPFTEPLPPGRRIEGTFTPEAASGEDARAIEVTRKGPWNFDTTFPSPDPTQVNRLEQEGRSPFDANTPEEVHGILTETMADLKGRAEAAKHWTEQLALIDKGLSHDVRTQKGGNPKAVATKNLENAERDFNDLMAEVENLWPAPAVAAIRAFARGEPQPAPSIDAAAAQADTAPTDGQKEAGNYQMGHAAWHGLDLTIETARGETRSGTTPDGAKWSVTLPAHYGYIRGTTGRDKDHLDFYMGPHPESPLVVVIDQRDLATGKYDEHKLILGAETVEEALALYKAGFSDGKGAERIGGITEMDAGELVALLAKNPHWDKPASPNYTDAPAPDNKTDQPDNTPAPKAPPAKLSPKDQRAAQFARIETYFAPGNVVAGYGGVFDRVISFAPTPDGGFKVTVIHAEKAADGTWHAAPGAEARTHQTTPDERELRRGPVYAAPQAAPKPAPQPTPKPAPKPSAGADAPLIDWSGTDINGQDGKRDDGKDSAIKNRFSADAQRFLKSVAAALDALGFTPPLDAKSRPLKPVSFNMGGVAVSGEASLRMQTPNGLTVRVQIDQSYATASRGGVSILLQFLDGSRFVGPNEWLDASATPSNIATRVNALAGKLAPAPILSDKEAQAAGAKAFAQGLDRRLPYDLAASQPDAIRKAWLAGWDRANLAAPVSEKPAPSPTPAPAPAPAPSPPSPPKPGKLANLSEAENAELAALEAEFLNLIKNQTSSGVDPHLVSVAFKIGALYVKAGTRRFRALLDALMTRMGLTLDEAQPYARAAYNQIRDDMELAGERVSDMDTSAEVLAEIRKLREDAKSSESGPIGDKTGPDQTGSGPDLGQPAPGDTLPPGDNADAGNQIPQTDRPPVAGPSSKPLRPLPEGGDAGPGTGGQGAGDRRPGAGAGGGRNGPRAGGGGRPQGGGLRAPGKRPGVKPAPLPLTTPEPQPPAAPESPLTTEAGITVPGTNFTITEAQHLGEGSEAVKFADNLAAISLLKQIEAENRGATPSEQAILARYVGWGGLKNAFRVAGSAPGAGVAAGWEARVAQLEELLEPHEIKAARNSTLAAHYTSKPVVDAMWQIAERLGFVGGAVLEPSVGVGNFLGLMPEGLRGQAQVFATEYDSLTARIAQKLYPQSTILHSPFQNVPLPANSFALAIGNPPFGKESLYFKNNAGLQGRTIHNQFLLQSLRGVAPGGHMVMVVSHYLMDALDSTNRKDLARMGDFVGGIRLPSNAFLENAGTEVVTDILVFKKRDAGTEAQVEAALYLLPLIKANPLILHSHSGAMIQLLARKGVEERPFLEDMPPIMALLQDFAEWVPAERVQGLPGAETPDGIPVNRYFVNEPGHVIGSVSATGTMYGRGSSLNVTLANPSEIESRLGKLVETIFPHQAPADAISERTNQSFATMAKAMELAARRAEPGSVTQGRDGGLKLVVFSAASDAGKGLLVELPLTQDTPWAQGYSYDHASGKWQVTTDVVDAAGEPVKKAREDGTPSRYNQKSVKTFESLKDIPEKDRWGAERIAVMRATLPIKDTMRRQYQLESLGGTEAQIAENRAALNRVHDAFVKAHGAVNATANARVISTLPDGANALATEVSSGAKWVKSAIMGQRTSYPPAEITSAANPTDAVSISLSESGTLDLERLSQLLGLDQAGVEEAIGGGETPLAYYDPEEARWMPADLYLSGLVKRKANAAMAAGLAKNAAALEAVMPPRIEAMNITPALGSSWIPARVYGDFARSLGYRDPAITYAAGTNTYTLAANGRAHPQWSSSEGGMEAIEILERTLNSMPIKVTYRDKDGATHVDLEATAESQMRASEIEAEFQDWAWRDPERTEMLTSIFNEKFNTRVIRQRDGSHLTFPGKNPAETLRRHQVNAIWRGITDRAVLYDHAVGAGKTWVAVARHMERRRMGISRKALVVVPNHILDQWRGDIHQLYPGANVLVAGPDDFKGPARRLLFAKIAAGDYDLTVIGHSSFGFISIDPATEERFVDDELKDAVKGLADAHEAAAEAGFGGGRSKPLGVRLAEQLVTKLQTRLDKIRDRARDTLLTFEEMGIDDLTIDESHEFKNLAYSSRLQNVAGMGNKVGSEKAIDLHLKVRSLMERQGTGIAFLSGTPVSNSVAKLYLVLRNLARGELKALGIENFDAWRAMFVSATTAFEPTETGSLKEVARLGREWTNMRALMDLVYSVTDAVSLDDVKATHEAETGQRFPVPETRSQREDGKDREMVAIKPEAAQRAILRQIVHGFEGLPSIGDPMERNKERLRLMDRARKVSLDARALDPSAPVPDGTGKIGAIVDRVAKIHATWTPHRGTQLIFLDRSVPKGQGDQKVVDAYDAASARYAKAEAAGDEAGMAKAQEALDKFDHGDVEARRTALAGGWNAYAEIKRQLIARGVPAHEIAFVQDYDKPVDRAALFAAMNAGEVRVLIGSTPKLGAGTNVQKRLVALHHADVTWKPSDIEQREGRIIRQGNELLKLLGHDGFMVDVIAYATEMTIDAKMWALNSDKLKAINGLRKYDGAFGMEVEDAESASMAEMAALATGNPMMIERVTLKSEVDRLAIKRRAFNNRMAGVRGELARAETTVAEAPGKIAAYKAVAEKITAALAGVATRVAARSVTVEGKTFTDAGLAGEAALAAVTEQRKGDEKARFKIEIGGAPVTTMDDIKNAITHAFGDEGFEAVLGGKTLISLNEAGAALAREVSAARAKFAHLDTASVDMTLLGMPVEIEAFKGPYDLKPDAYTVDAQIREQGRTVALSISQVDRAEMHSATGRAILARLMPQIDAAEATHAAEWATNAKAMAEERIPELKALAGETWPQAVEYDEKTQRLAQVIHEIAQSTDSARLAEDGVVPAGAQERRGPAIPLQGPADRYPTNKNIETLRAALAAELKSVGLGAFSLKLAAAFRADEATGGILSVGQPKHSTILGYFLGREIGTSYDNELGARAVLRHEILHALRSSTVWGMPYGVFTRAEWQTLVTAARGRRDLMAQMQAAYPELNGLNQIEEVIADMFMEWSAARDAQGPLAQIMAKIGNAFQAIINALKGGGFHSAAGVFEAARSGALAARAPALQAAMPHPYLSDAAVAAAMRARKPVTGEEEHTIVNQALTQVMAGGKISVLGLVPGRALFDELGRKLVSAQVYTDMKDRMDALRDAWQAWADDRAVAWRKELSKDPKMNTAMMDLMHETTIAQIDPSEDFIPAATRKDYEHARSVHPSPGRDVARAKVRKNEAQRAEYDRFVQRFAALSEPFRAIYVQTRKDYARLADAHEKAVTDNIEKAMKINIKRAERRYEDRLREIDDEGLVGGERTQALNDAAGALETTRFKMGLGMKSRVYAMRSQFEANRLRGPYFPLTRYGEFFAAIRNGEGKIQGFYRFESVRARDKFVRAEGAIAGQNIETGVIEDTDLRQMVDPNFVADVEEILAGSNTPKAVKDQIWQRWLETLPELSIRRNRIHRKGTPGYSNDAFRNYGRHMFHGAHQLARVTYTLDLSDALEEATREAARSKDPTRNGLIVSEMKRRNDYTMNPAGAAWSQLLTTAGYVWFLAVSPAAAMVNLTQTTIVGIPMLAAMNGGRGGFKQATAQVTRAGLDFTRGKGHATESGRLTDDEKQAMSEAYDAGLIDKSMSHDLAGIEAHGTAYKEHRTRVMAAISFLFHHAERMNREVTYLAGYRMARLQGMDHAAAVKAAAQVTWKAHFDYQNSARPRLMQGNTARVLLAMRNFQVNMIWRLFRDTHQVFAGESPELRKEARTQLFGVTASLMLHAGISGTWLFGMAMTIAGLIFGGGADKWKEEFKGAVIAAFGSKIGGALWYGLPSVATGTALTDRIGMPDLWFRSPDRPAEGEDAYNQWLQALVGPVPSIARSYFLAAQKVGAGQYERGLEMMLPKFMRDILKAERYLQEGATTSNGDPLVDHVGALDALKQALGFTPGSVAEAYEVNARLYAEQTRILDERNQVIGGIANALVRGDAFSPAMQAQIDAFNAANPEKPIDGSSIIRSQRMRQKNHDRNEGGAMLDPDLNDTLRAQRAGRVFN